MSRAVVQLKNLSKSYGELELISSLSLTIFEGERVAFIGPSGGGKTSLLRIISNFVAPDCGEVFIFEKKINQYHYRDLAKKVGMMRQSLDLVPQLNVLNNVLAGKLGDWGLLKSMISLVFPREKSEAEQALKRVGILEKINEVTKNLSGGEQQRVALARLLLQNSHIILADEPVASLDPARAEDILSLIRDVVQEERKTLVASIHSVEYAKKYFTRVVGIRNGSIHFDLKAEQLSQEQLDELYQIEVG